MRAAHMDEITKEAVEIVRIAGRLRVAHQKGRGSRATTISAAELISRPAPPLPGEPAPGETAEEVFAETIHWWARRVASAVTSTEWDRMVWVAKDAVPEFDGCVVSWFERRFEGLRLKDGTLVVP